MKTSRPAIREYLNTLLKVRNRRLPRAKTELAVRRVERWASRHTANSLAVAYRIELMVGR